MGHVIITQVLCPRCGAVVGSRCTASNGQTVQGGTHARRINAFQNTMQRAFHLVNPAAQAQELARRGLISQEAADRQDWRGEIAIALTLEAIEAEGLTLQNVEDSILFMTGTVANVIPAQIAGEAWISYLKPRPGFLILADGYRKGPAGP